MNTPYESSDSTPSAASGPADSPDAIRAERDTLAARQQRLADVLNCPPEKIEHELRNLLNELRLLRTLFESQKR